MRFRSVLGVALGAMMCIGGLTGCMHQQTGTVQQAPTNVYVQAATLMDNIGSEVQTAQRGVINLHRSGAVPDALYGRLQSIFRQVGVSGRDIDRAIRGQASAKTISDKITAALGDLTNVSANIAQLDPQTLSQVQSYAQVVQDLLKQVLALFLPAASAALTAPQENSRGSSNHRTIGADARAVDRRRSQGLQGPAQLCTAGGFGDQIAGGVGGTDHGKRGREVCADRGRLAAVVSTV